MALLTSAVSVQAQLPEFEFPENVSINIALELLPDARCHISISAEAQFETGGLENLPIGLENLPITSGSLNLEVSSPSFGQLKLDGSGSVTLSGAGLAGMSDEMRWMLAMMNVETINNDIASLGLEGKYLSEILSEMWMIIPGAEPIELPPEVPDFKVESIECTKFSWSEPTLEAGLTTTLSGSIFENEGLYERLPITVDGLIDVSETSISLSIDASSKTGEFTLDIDVTIEDSTVTMELILDGYFDLPRDGNRVQWNFNVPEAEMIPLENLGESLENYDIDFTLKVPENATVSDLPPGYSQEDNAYMWSGGDAGHALGLILTGETEGNVTYEYEEPPSEFPWMIVGVLVVVVVVIVVIAVAVVVLRR